MAIKYTFLGLLIYFAMTVYVLGFLAGIAGLKKISRLLYFSAFIISVYIFGFRWHQVGHVPFQNMFELFLSMSMMIYPLSLFCKRFLDVGGETVDMLIGAVLLFPAGFVLKAEPQMLPPALQCWLFIPHVAVYLLSYLIMTKAVVQASRGLVFSPADVKANVADYEQQTYRMVCMGFAPLTLGLMLGSWWGKLAWGDYWNWDPKELWSFVTWLVYVGYFHFRYMFGKKHPRLNSLWVLIGFVCIIITLLWVNLSKLFPGLHNYSS